MTEDRFTELLVKDLSGEILPDEKEELGQFLKNDSYMRRHQLFKIYWAEQSSGLSDSDALLKKVYHKINQAEPQKGEEDHANKPILKRRWLQVAAVLMIFLLSALFYRNYKPALSVTDNWQEKVTVRGDKMSFMLDDGTRITLNSASKLQYPAHFSGASREVYLSGEAYFDVKRDRERPFIIHTGRTKVRVLGTTFNIKAYPEEQINETTLISGSVEVMLKDRPGDKVILKPAEKLVVDYSGSKAVTGPAKDRADNPEHPVAVIASITYMRKQDSSVVETSWVQNRLIFKNESLEEICRSLERWYNVNIVIKNDQLKQVRFSVTFAGETIDGALKALQYTDPFRYRKEGEIIYIY